MSVSVKIFVPAPFCTIYAYADGTYQVQFTGGPGFRDGVPATTPAVAPVGIIWGGGLTQLLLTDTLSSLRARFQAQVESSYADNFPDDHDVVFQFVYLDDKGLL